MRRIPIIRASSREQTLEARHIDSLDGEPIASAWEAPALLVPRIVAEARREPIQARAVRHGILARAGRLFAEATLDGQSPAAYCVEASAVSGLPVSVFSRALGSYASTLADIGSIVAAQKPNCARPLDEAAFHGVGSASVWVPRGRVLGVVAPGNHPEAHVGWLQALAFGYNVVVRPSRRDPMTPLRLVHALLEAGLRAGEISYALGDHRAGEALVDAADLALVYGGTDTVRAFRHDRRVLVRGPGRTKIVATARDLESPERLELVARGVAADGGTRCTNASALLVDGDHEAVAAALARALVRLPSLPRDHRDAVLQTLTRSDAEAVRAAFDAARGDAPDLCRDVDSAPAVAAVAELAVLRPAVVVAKSSRAPAFASEFPFPCVWVAPWTPQDGVAPLRDSLVLSVMTGDVTLIEAALREPSIRKVFSGDVPTFHSAPLLPHDGALADFLFETKAFSSSPEVRNAS